MPRTKTVPDQDMLLMALYGYEQKRLEIEAKIRELKGKLGNVKISLRANGNGLEKQPLAQKRNLSADARERIASAQRRRWAAHRKNKQRSAKA